MSRITVPYLILIFLITASIATAAPTVDRVLFITSGNNHYSFVGYNSVSLLRLIGAQVDHIHLTTNAGAVASALASTQYSQVWHYDLIGISDAVDLSVDYKAIGKWYANHPTKHIIVDGRYLGSHYSPPSGTTISIPPYVPAIDPFFGTQLPFYLEGLQVVENYYKNMKAVGGGIVLMTDHWPFSVVGHNDISALIGIGGSYGYYNGELGLIRHPLTTIPNKLENLANHTSTGGAPYGLQVGGRIMYPVGFHSQHFSTPAISTTIRGCVFMPEPLTNLIPALK